MKNTIATLLITCMALAGCKDPCEGIACFNGGICQEGDCLCPPQWTGSQCKEEVPPVRMTANMITATWPNYDANGIAWDLTTAPDVMLVLKGPGHNGEVIAFVENQEDGWGWQFNPPIEFTAPTSTYTIEFWDNDDQTSDDYMGSVSFVPYQPGYMFPGSLFFVSQDFNYSISLDGLTYYH